ncbi:MAG TPA: hypothetical protein DEF34_03435 [Desulfotomaculum sp.]|nr:MAG: hypothetical protein JL56_03045 [Desulfotomaculum sp. BICA1-6]HBX22681.1 hypothetical protein [Desulfotomaculum sp.]
MTEEEVYRVQIKRMHQDINEVKGNVVRVHERLDEIVKNGIVGKKECEDNRDKCRHCKGDYIQRSEYENDLGEVKEALKAFKNYVPPWMVVVFSVCSAAIAIILTYAFTGGVGG